MKKIRKKNKNKNKNKTIQIEEIDSRLFIYLFHFLLIDYE